MYKVISGIKISLNEFIFLYIKEFNKEVCHALISDKDRLDFDLLDFLNFTNDCKSLTADTYFNIDKYIEKKDKYHEIYSWIKNPILYDVRFYEQCECETVFYDHRGFFILGYCNNKLSNFDEIYSIKEIISKEMKMKTKKWLNDLKNKKIIPFQNKLLNETKLSNNCISVIIKYVELQIYNYKIKTYIYPTS
jgi:hypothetical protein